MAGVGDLRGPQTAMAAGWRCVHLSASATLAISEGVGLMAIVVFSLSSPTRLASWAATA
jgi:hypothetical protein